MKFTFERDAMIREISIAQEIISAKQAADIRSNVALYASNNTLTLKATDSKVNFESQIPIQITEEGSTTIFCDKFMGILTALPEGEIEFNQETDSSSETAINVVIRPVGKKIKFQIKSISAEKFPNFSSADEVPYFDVPAHEFKEMITQTVFAVSDDITRLFMNGVFFEKKEDNLILVATDGKRLSYDSKQVLAGVSDFPSVIIPPKILNIIAKRAPDEGNIAIAVVDKMIFFRFGTYKFGSVLIEGQIPNYERVIPEKQDHNFRVTKSDLNNALKRVALMVDKKAGRLYFNISSGVLKITSQNMEMGNADEEIPCEYDGDNYVIALNYRYVDEPLKVMEAEKITFEFTEEMKPVTMRPEPAGDFFHVIMPMQKE
ncbi:MAG: DNA polymerase III subunit beta [Treponema sp.]|nr:DNA polymerase III subunit beta [Treponema sp.]